MPCKWASVNRNHDAAMLMYVHRFVQLSWSIWRIDRCSVVGGSLYELSNALDHRFDRFWRSSCIAKAKVIRPWALSVRPCSPTCRATRCADRSSMHQLKPRLHVLDGCHDSSPLAEWIMRSNVRSIAGIIGSCITLYVEKDNSLSWAPETNFNHKIQLLTEIN
jgi:hypothetical protein